jgi:hypothetical protein
LDFEGMAYYCFQASEAFEEKKAARAGITTVDRTRTYAEEAEGK